MNIVERVKNIIVTPKTEWDVIAAEPTQPKDLTVSYVLPLAAIAAIAGFISASIIGFSLLGVTSRTPIMWGIIALVYQLVMAVVSTFIVAFIVDALAPSFGGQKNFNQAFKVVAYSYTAAWVGAIFVIIPWVGPLLALIASLYCLYLLYLGLPRLMRNPAEKTIVYEIVVVVVAIVVSLVIGAIGGLITGGAMMGAAMQGAATAPNVTYDKDSAAGKLDQFAKKMEEANKKMEAAEKSGDPNKQMEAAMAALGTAMSGGKGVEPVQIDALRPFVPETFAGLPRNDLRTERGGISGLMTAKAEGVYGDNTGKTARLEVTDTGGVAGLMGVATWMNVQGEKENADRRESTRREGKRLVHEEVSKRGGTNKYTVVLADRYMVEARGNVDIAALKAGVAAIDLGKLESLK